MGMGRPNALQIPQALPVQPGGGRQGNASTVMISTHSIPSWLQAVLSLLFGLGLRMICAWSPSCSHIMHTY